MPTASSVSTSPTGASRHAAGRTGFLPGDGVADLPALLGALERAGWDGFYDLEIFSDNGTFGNAWPGSLWGRSEEELAGRGKDAFERAWSARNRTPLDQVSPGAV